MSNDPTLNSTQLRPLLERYHAGDRQAGEAIFWSVLVRMERLARHMLRGFPDLRRWADTTDITQGAVARLLPSLRAARPTGVRDFLGLAAVQIRRELLDLARRYRRRPDARTVPNGEGDLLAEIPAGAGAADDLDLWAAFHEEVEKLPAEEREVVGLTFYHGWSTSQIAELFGVDERTVRRRWRSASLKLAEALGGWLPEA